MLRSFLAGASRLCRQAGAASAARSTPPPPLARGYKKRYLDAAAVGDIYVKGKGTTIPPGSPIVIGQNMAGILSLNNLRDNPGSRKTITRVGRGIGSGKGKTCGRGHKGQKSRSGAPPETLILSAPQRAPLRAPPSPCCRPPPADRAALQGGRSSLASRAARRPS